MSVEVTAGGTVTVQELRHDQPTWILNPRGATTGVASGQPPDAENIGNRIDSTGLRDSRKETMVDAAQREDRRAQG